MRDRGFAGRLFDAWLRYQRLAGGETSRRVPQEWLAQEVSRMLALKEPYTQSAASRWLKGSVPSLRTIVAIAKLLRVDPGWLAFGEDSQAPPPDDPMGKGMKKH